MHWNSWRGMGQVYASLLIFCGFILPNSVAAQYGQHSPFVAIIIDDIGHDHAAGMRAIRLPGQVTLAFLPYTPFVESLGQAAAQHGKEAMLHLPMEADSGYALGAGGIDHTMHEAQVREVVHHALRNIPFVRGVNNHMGSRLSRYPHHMTWVMAELHAYHQAPLYFVDSRTHVQTVAEWVARWAGLPHTRRHVFLDHVPHDALHTREQVQRLRTLAHRQGYALAIGHPFATTLQVLEEEIPRFAQDGIRLLFVSDYIQEKQEKTLWHASLSPSPKAAKNSKPLP